MNFRKVVIWYHEISTKSLYDIISICVSPDLIMRYAMSNNDFSVDSWYDINNVNLKNFFIISYNEMSLFDIMQ